MERLRFRIKVPSIKVYWVLTMLLLDLCPVCRSLFRVLQAGSSLRNEVRSKRTVISLSSLSLPWENAGEIILIRLQLNYSRLTGCT